MAGGIFSDPACATAGCGRPTTDAYLCWTCRDTLTSELAHIIEFRLGGHRGVPLPGLAAELTTTLLRSDHVGSESVGWIRYTPDNALPYAQHASDAADRLRNTLSTWIRDLWEINGGDDIGPLNCANSLVDMARWLQLRPSWMALHPAAGELYTDIIGAITHAWRVVDRAPERAYSGICGAQTEAGECGQPLYSAPEHEWVRCRTCGAEWVVAERRQWLLAHAELEPLTATRMAGLLNHAGITVTSAQIRSFAAHGRIEAAGRNDRGHPTYLIVDVRKALADRYKKRNIRGTRSA